MILVRLAAIAIAAAMSIGSVWAACPGCCSSNGGISNSCAANGRIYCNDGTISPSCLCSTCGVVSPPSGTPGALSITPDALTFASQATGSSSAPSTVTLTNVGGQSVLVLGVSSNSAEFAITSACSSIAVAATCTFTVVFRPTSAGTRTATITVSSTGLGSPQVLSASGIATGAGIGPPPATPPPTNPPTTPPTIIDLVEYHHEAWDDYFITGIADEIAKLDNGAFAGWARTGLEFKGYPTGAPQGVTVCRFFSGTSFAPRSSHFFTPYPNECTIVKGNPDWGYEGDVFRINVPDVGGTCPSGTLPVYRLYNNGQGGAPNHRHTTDLTLRAQMLAQGWIPEGYGPLGVIMCAPI